MQPKYRGIAYQMNPTIVAKTQKVGGIYRGCPMHISLPQTVPSSKTAVTRQGTFLGQPYLCFQYK